MLQNLACGKNTVAVLYFEVVDQATKYRKDQ